LNILDGVTATAAELNILDGVTATAAELNILDGVTATTAELNQLDTNTFTSAITLNANGAEGGEILLRNPDNSTVGLGVDVASANNGRIFQTANNSVLQIGQISGTGGTVSLFTAGDSRLAISAAGVVSIPNTAITGGTINGTTIGATTASTGSFTTLTLGGTAITSTAAEINKLNGVTATTAELNQLDTNTFTSDVAISAATTEARNLNIGQGRTGNGSATIDLIGDATNTDFALRVTRGSAGVNANSSIVHRGAGSLLLIAQDAGSVITSTDNVTRLTINNTGGLILAGSTAQKATGTTWSNPSDQRLKQNITDYPKGIPELMQVRVCEWEYNGKGGTTDGMRGIGVIADEVMTVLPDTVDTYDAKLNETDEETTAIKKFDATEITWLLVKAVQEQQATILALEARIAALESK
jgi:hypothetical protein